SGGVWWLFLIAACDGHPHPARHNTFSPRRQPLQRPGSPRRPARSDRARKPAGDWHKCQIETSSLPPAFFTSLGPKNLSLRKDRSTLRSWFKAGFQRLGLPGANSDAGLFDDLHDVARLFAGGTRRAILRYGIDQVHDIGIHVRFVRYLMFPAQVRRFAQVGA